MSIMFELNIADILAIAISFFALWIVLKNRRNAMRENIFNRQVDALTDILNEMDNLDMIISEIVDYKKENNNEKVQNEIKKADQAFQKLEDKIEKHMLIIPEDLEELLGNYLDFLDLILEKSKKGDYLPNINKLLNVYLTIEDSFREFIGLEKLSRENRRLVK